MAVVFGCLRPYAEASSGGGRLREPQRSKGSQGHWVCVNSFSGKVLAEVYHLLLSRHSTRLVTMPSCCLGASLVWIGLAERSEMLPFTLVGVFTCMVKKNDDKLGWVGDVSIT